MNNKTEPKPRTKIDIRLTIEEKKTIQGHARSDRLTVSDYIKRTALKKTVLANRVEYTADLRGLNFEINRIGNNINQIARHFNSTRPARPDFRSLEDLMAACLEKMAEAEDLLKRMYARLAKA